MATPMMPEVAAVGAAGFGPVDAVPHLAGPAADVRQVLAAHFVRGFEHVVEIGGHPRPLTSFLVHVPRSVLMVDPKAEPMEADSLNGQPCQVRHVAAKFQCVEFSLPANSYALVLLGLSLKGYGRRDALDAKLYDLLDGAARVVVDYAPALERAAGQIPALLSRPGLVGLCTLDLELVDGRIIDSPYRRRRLVVLDRVAPP